QLHHRAYSTLAGKAKSCYFLAGWLDKTPGIVEISNSYLRGSYQNAGAYTYTASTGTMQNNLLERSSWSFQQFTTNAPLTLNQYNNLFWHGTQGYYYYLTNTTWTVRDNLFHSDSLSGNGSNFNSSNNGY